MAITIYGHPGTRSPLVNWGAIEAGMDFQMGDLAKNPHPFGQLPCVTDDAGVVVFESGACLEYFHQQTSAKTLSKKDAAAVISWIVFANASLDPICFKETPTGQVIGTGLTEPNRKIDRINTILSNQDFLLGDTFSLADVAVASYLLYVVLFFPDSAGTIRKIYPHVADYMTRCANRDAYGAAFGEETKAKLLDRMSIAPKDKKLFGVF
jgi:glutathione S-transferase